METNGRPASIRAERKPAERTAFLDAACAGDEAMRKEVESLLASNEHAESFLKFLAVQGAAALIADNKSNSMLGQRIGSYQTISQLGAGASRVPLEAQHVIIYYS